MQQLNMGQHKKSEYLQRFKVDKLTSQSLIIKTELGVKFRDENNILIFNTFVLFSSFFLPNK